MAELPARDEEGIIVVRAHYDTVPGTPGANDNASGVAALLVSSFVGYKRKKPLLQAYCANM